METRGITRSLIDDLREQIIIGQFAPGERINEKQITSDLGISRSPLREALRVLEKERLITSLPRRGSFVTEISLEDSVEIYQMSEMIECYAIDLLKSQQVRDLPQVALWADKAHRLKMPSPKSTPKEKLAYRGNAAEFHIKLVEATGNGRLLESYLTIHSNITRYLLLNSLVNGIDDERIQQHYQILECLKLGHYEKAKKVLKNHIRSAHEQLKRKMVDLEPVSP